MSRSGNEERWRWHFAVVRYSMSMAEKGDWSTGRRLMGVGRDWTAVLTEIYCPSGMKRYLKLKPDPGELRMRLRGILARDNRKWLNRQSSLCLLRCTRPPTMTHLLRRSTPWDTLWSVTGCRP